MRRRLDRGAAGDLPVGVPHPFTGRPTGRHAQAWGHWVGETGLPRGVEPMGYTEEGIPVHEGEFPSHCDPPAKQMLLRLAQLGAPKLSIRHRVRMFLVRVLLAIAAWCTRRRGREELP